MKKTRFLHVRTSYYGGPLFVVIEYYISPNGTVVKVGAEYQATEKTWSSLMSDPTVGPIALVAIVDELHNQVARTALTNPTELVEKFL